MGEAKGKTHHRKADQDKNKKEKPRRDSLPAVSFTLEEPPGKGRVSSPFVPLEERIRGRFPDVQDERNQFQLAGEKPANIN